MSTQLISRNNVVAGLFVILSIVLAVVIAFTLSDVQEKFASRTEYIVRFPTDVGVTGLKPGAEVTFGGLSVGQVRAIRALSEKDSVTGVDVVRSHDVVISVRSDLVLYEDAYGDLVPPLLGGVSRINIPSPGTGSYEGGPSDPDSLLGPGEVIRGRFAPSILAQLGFTTEEAEAIKETIHKVREISEHVDDVSESVKRMVEHLEPEFGQGVDDGRMTLANIRELSERLNGEGGWSSRIDAILGNADEAVRKLEPFIDDSRDTVAEARSILEENREKVSSILDNVNTTTERVKLETMDQIDELLSKGTLALGSYKDVADNANNLVLSNSPKIAATLDSARDIGVQGKLLIEEIRAQPWRLLKKPSPEELLREPIYEAARAYASAVADLRAASEALDAAVLRAASGADADSLAQIRQVAEVVDAAYERYSEAERRLLERLRGEPPRRNP